MLNCVVCEAPAKYYCEADQAYLCKECDKNIHSSNVLASRHLRIAVCDLCTNATATVYCRNDKASLCDGCDADVHQNNPLAACHEILPATKTSFEQDGICGNADCCAKSEVSAAAVGFSDFGEVSKCFSLTGTEGVVPQLPLDDIDFPVVSTKNATDFPLVSKMGAFGKDFDFLDLDNAWFDRLDAGLDFSDILGGDGLVPTIDPLLNEDEDDCLVPTISEMNMLKRPAQIDDLAAPVTKKPSLVSGPSANTRASAGVGGAIGISASSSFHLPKSTLTVVPPPDNLTREQRVARWREKRKHRKFEKTIRYASRKAYAEVRPRIKGRFARKEEVLAWRAGGGNIEDYEDALVPDIVF